MLNPNNPSESMSSSPASSPCPGLNVIETVDEISSFVDQFDTFILDCDGVLWESGSVFPGTLEALSALRSRGKKLVFLTNNSTKSRRAYHQKLQALDPHITEEEVFCSSYLGAQYLKRQCPHVKKAYVVGDVGILEELRSVGIEPLGGPDHSPLTMDEAGFKKLAVDPEIAAVVCGWDQNINFYKICYASVCLQTNAGCVFVATNNDSFDMIEGRGIPANGCIVAALQVASGKTPVVAGKPSAWVIDSLVEQYKLDRKRICVVGDRLDTDILLGKNAQVSSLLVLTGVTSPAQAEEELHKHNRGGPSIVPDFVIRGLPQLAQLPPVQ
eukprot:GILI01007112.1.p1 GENE.GILI01007112.1~~GILI01007112.1.p1  ORF type:complete len:327 (-),score=72.51 GILI01007112.1:164-1144(-)